MTAIGVQRGPETDAPWAPTIRDWGDLIAVLHRLAIALEQSALVRPNSPDISDFDDLVPLTGNELPPPPLPPVGGAVAQAPAVSPAPVTVAPQNLVCPVHKKPFRNGRYGWFCATKLADDSWCNQKPA